MEEFWFFLGGFCLAFSLDSKKFYPWWFVAGIMSLIDGWIY